MRHIAADEEKLLRAIAEHHIPALARSQIDPLPSAEGNRAYLFNAGPRLRVIVRLVEDLKIHKLQDELCAIDILTQAGLPVPEVLVADLSKSRFPVLYRITRFIEGYDLEEGITTGRVGEEDEVSLAAAWGELMGKFHAIHGTTLAKPGLHEQPSPASWPEFLGRLIDKHVKLARTRALIDASTQARLQSLCTASLDALDPGIGGEFTHRDLHPGNVIIEERGIGYFLNGIIDLEHCRFWDRLWDFAKLEWFVFDRHPSLREPFLRAYQALQPRPPDFDQRTRLYRAAEALISLTYFSGLDSAKAELFTRALAAELR
ncbi:MAG: aminoglycoside phosphotransferase family protein [Planctomycetota bacterium]